MPELTKKGKLRSLLNLAGLGLWIAFWPKVVDRLLALFEVGSPLTEQARDLNTIVLVTVTLLVTAISAIARHEETSNQVAWIERSLIPFLSGWLLTLMYALIVALTLGKT